jgi:hypothetical protein
MAHRSRTTFQKRQKELARVQKQRDKFALRMQRKAEKRLLQAEPAAAEEAAASPAPLADDSA